MLTIKVHVHEYQDSQPLFDVRCKLNTSALIGKYCMEMTGTTGVWSSLLLTSLYLLLQVIISTRISENYHREAHKERIIQTSLWNCWLWFILWYISLNQPIPALFSCVCTSDNFRGTLLFGRALKTMKSKVVLLLMNC